MRFSIKFKLPLVVFAVFLLLTMSFTCYYRLFIVKEAQNNFNFFESNLFQVSDEISRGISIRYPDRRSIDDFIHTVSQRENIKVTVFDMNGTVILSEDNKKENGFQQKTRDLVKAEGKPVYIFEIETAYGLVRNLLGITFGSRSMYFAILMLFLTFLFLVILLHYYIVKPLSKLQSNFDMVNHRRNAEMVNIHRKDEIGDLYNNFVRMTRKLETSYIQQNEMISSISHDLKTPLTSIMGYVERLSLANVKTEEKKQEYYRIIYKKAQDIEKLVEEFSEYAKNEIDCMRIQKETVLVEDFLYSIYLNYKEELEVHRVELEYDYKLPRDVYFSIDVGKIERVFANLITNSLKYVEAPIKLNIQCRLQDKFIFFSSEDNGAGVPQEELSNIFTRFYRVEKSRSREKGGSGLGLTICKSIIESHGGEIWAYNVKGGGLGIAFLIPLLKDYK